MYELCNSTNDALTGYAIINHLVNISEKQLNRIMLKEALQKEKLKL